MTALHQEKQREIISEIEAQIKSNSLQATAVEPVADFEQDNRICLTSVHFPEEQFINLVHSTVSQPLHKVFPQAYFYPPSSLHLTIKNIRVVNDPPHFDDSDVKNAKDVFSTIIPRHHPFSIYPYRLLLFKNNLALMSTTDEELDKIVLDLNSELAQTGLPDDKTYVNSRYFFSNMTIARFSSSPPPDFIQAITDLSNSLNISAYTISNVSLISANAVMKNRTIYQTCSLRG